MLPIFGDLITILLTGFISGIICRYLRISSLVGLLIAGIIIGRGGLNLIASHGPELEQIAQTGVLLLLFAVGVEFSLEELVSLSRHALVGGATQMLLVMFPLLVAMFILGVSIERSIVVSAAVALSSTVLVYRTLAEWGQTSTPSGRRALAILVFQDLALIPLLLFMPVYSGTRSPGIITALFLTGMAVVFAAMVPIARYFFNNWIIPFLVKVKSVELTMLFVLVVLLVSCWLAQVFGLPPALGALAAGVSLSETRLTKQLDALVFPFRETFGVVFFVSLGSFVDWRILWQDPLWFFMTIPALLTLKALAGAVALRITRLTWRTSLGSATLLVPMSELSFVLLSEAARRQILTADAYERMLMVALASLVVSSELFRHGQRLLRSEPLPHPAGETPDVSSVDVSKAIVVGLGPIGSLAASQLESRGVDVCLIDQSPVNLHPFAQAGFRTVCGDARDWETLSRADTKHAQLAVICVPDDTVATTIVRILRQINPSCTIVVRCRYQSSRKLLQKAGAQIVISEESVTGEVLRRFIETSVFQLSKATAFSSPPGPEKAPEKKLSMIDDAPKNGKSTS
ncbi:MAG: cation:proton antiporter domain-containing protein [Thermogutta sp.]